MKRELTCIGCPMGCQMTVELENKNVLSVVGNTCAKGAEYAKDECTNPVRIVTSTVMTKDKRPVSVKTDRPIQKDKIFECMKVINSTVINTPVSVGDIVIENVFDCNIIATETGNV
jgi:CxxC motif-containing protein